eukprot:m.271653 g.271653  ORF g.271653 m.271653 type:complete len:333 (+) comp15683_c14_seq3:69-1067(+)
MMSASILTTVTKVVVLCLLFSALGSEGRRQRGFKKQTAIDKCNVRFVQRAASALGVRRNEVTCGEWKGRGLKAKRICTDKTTGIDHVFGCTIEGEQQEPCTPQGRDKPCPEFLANLEKGGDGVIEAGDNFDIVESGHRGIEAYFGKHFGVAHAPTDVSFWPFTRYGGYSSTFPTLGYMTEIAVYLEASLSDGVDRRFDFSSAINNPSGDHRRDFIFHVGTDVNNAGQWIASVSNNSPGWPANPGRNPVSIPDEGWYVLQHIFRDVAGVLAVELNIIQATTETTIGSWTLSDASDIIGTTVGGNRYGWFVDSGVQNLDEVIFDFVAMTVLSST